MSAQAPQPTTTSSPIIKLKAEPSKIRRLQWVESDSKLTGNSNAIFVGKYRDNISRLHRRQIPSFLAGRSDIDIHTAATAELYCSATMCFLPVTWLYGLLFSMWYGLFAGSCRLAEAENSGAFITAEAVEIVKYEHSCGCCGGQQRRVRIPLLSIVRVVSDEVWWARREERNQTPCCAKRAAGADRMVLGVFHRPVKQDLSGLRTTSVFFEFFYGLEDPYTFQRLLQAAMYKRQRGAAEAAAFVTDELLEAVSDVPDPNADEAALRPVVHPLDSRTFRVERQAEGRIMEIATMQRFPSTAEDNMLQQKQEAAYAGVTLEKLKINA